VTRTQSPNIADLLAEAGHDAVHVRDLDMEGSPDVDVLATARGEHRVVISADMTAEKPGANDPGGVCASQSARHVRKLARKMYRSGSEWAIRASIP
jgi:hypothetical protein